jgi:hypothetical protein
MWSYIHIDDGEDVAARVHTFLHLSRQHPLELASGFFGTQWESMLSIVRPQKERIRSIYMFNRGFRTSGWIIDPLREITFPEARRIETNGFGTNASAFEPLLALCPNLQYSVSTFFVNKEDFKWFQPGLRAVQGFLHSDSIESLMTSAQPILDLSNLE